MHIILKTWDEEERQVENVGTLTKFVQVIFLLVNVGLFLLQSRKSELLALI